MTTPPATPLTQSIEDRLTAAESAIAALQGAVEGLKRPPSIREICRLKGVNLDPKNETLERLAEISPAPFGEDVAAKEPPAKAKITKVGRVWLVSADMWDLRGWDFASHPREAVNHWPRKLTETLYGHTFADLAILCILENPREGDRFTYPFEMVPAGRVVGTLNRVYSNSGDYRGLIETYDKLKITDPRPIPPAQAVAEQPRVQVSKEGDIHWVFGRSERTEFWRDGKFIALTDDSESYQLGVSAFAINPIQAAAWFAAHPQPKQQTAIEELRPLNPAARFNKSNIDTLITIIDRLALKLEKRGVATQVFVDMANARDEALKQLADANALAAEKLCCGETAKYWHDGWEELQKQLAQRDKELAEAKKEQLDVWWLCECGARFTREHEYQKHGRTCTPCKDFYKGKSAAEWHDELTAEKQAAGEAKAIISEHADLENLARTLGWDHDQNESRTLINFYQQKLAADALAQAEAKEGIKALPSWWAQFILNVSELDRTSPADDPDVMLATERELTNCAINAIEAKIETRESK